MVSRGQVRWIIGDEHVKSRPGVVLSRGAAIGKLHSLIVAPVTSTIRDIPSEVPLGPAQGLPKPCVVNLDSISIVDVDLIGDLIAELDAVTMAAICAALEVAVGCDR
jgi:mRNA interferase MazF